MLCWVLGRAAGVAAFRKEDDCGEEYRSGEVEEHVLHGVAQGFAAGERDGFVEGPAALEELLGVKSEHAVCHIFHHFPEGSDCQDKADYPDEGECGGWFCRSVRGGFFAYGVEDAVGGDAKQDAG